MIWAILALLGVPLWLCAAGITMIVFSEPELAQAPRRHSGSCEATGEDALDPWPCGLGIGRVRVAG